METNAEKIQAAFAMKNASIKVRVIGEQEIMVAKGYATYFQGVEFVVDRDIILCDFEDKRNIGFNISILEILE